VPQRAARLADVLHSMPHRASYRRPTLRPFGATIANSFHKPVAQGGLAVSNLGSLGAPRHGDWHLDTAHSAAPGAAAGSPTEILMGRTVFLIWSGILGGLCSILAGCISARIAKYDDVLNGALSSILCIGSGVYTVLSGGAAGHLGLHLVGFVLSPALGTLGGYLRARRKPQKL
jgi:hypothetical protein